MKKIYMILPPILPCPDVQGGAVEKLLTNLIKENEKKGLMQLNIISKYHKEAEKESRKYKNTNFIYIKLGFKYKIAFLLYRVFKKMNIKILSLNFYYHCAFKRLDKDTDYIIAEGGNGENYEEFSKYFGKKKMILHIHGATKSNDMLNEIFGNVMGVSQFCIDYYQARQDVKTMILKNGIEVEKFDKKLNEIEKQKICQKFNINKNDFVILFCGRLVQIKGVLELIKAVKKMQNDKIKLLIIGSPNFAAEANSKYVEELKREAEDLKKQIIFTGYVPNQELYQYYQISDIQVIPSLCEETAGLVAIEGMSSGLPIIATKSGGIVEYIDNNCAEIIEKEDIILKLKEAIFKLYSDEAKRKRMSNYGKEKSKQYSMQKYYEDFVALIQQI